MITMGCSLGVVGSLMVYCARLARLPETVADCARAGGSPDFPEYERRGRMAAGDAEKDEEFLRHVRERAEQQRQRYEADKKRQQQEGEEPV